MFNKTRETRETKVTIALAEKKIDFPDFSERKNDGFEQNQINTGIGFLDHMLTLFAFHAGLFLRIEAEGDLQVDGHHTVEDIGIVLGELIYQLYHSKKSFARYGFFYLPMDEALVRVALDLSGRPGLYFSADFSKEKVGEFDTELIKEFFNALAMNAKMTLHIDLLKTGNTHHEIEAIFKAFGHSLRIALQETEGDVPSSKGVLA